MDKKLLLGLSLAASLPALAQPTLEFPAATPEAGSSFMTSYAAHTSPGNAGADQTWDFSGLIAESSSITYVVPPDWTSQGSLFQDATAAVINEDGTEFFRATPLVLELHGLSYAGQTIPLSDPGDHLPFPCTFETEWQDVLGGNAMYQNVPVVISGSVTGNADGYGTLVLPEGPVENVLRVHRSINLILESAAGNADLVYETFAFYHPDLGVPVLEISSITGVFLEDDVDIQALRWVDVNTVGIPDRPTKEVGISLYPNPAGREARLDLALMGGHTVSITMFDAQGRQVREWTVNTGASDIHSSTIGVQDLPAGMYTLRAVNDLGHTGTARLQVL